MKLLTELDSLDNVKDGETRKLITKTTSSGSGNVVSSVSVSGDTITYTKGVTALTAHQNAFSNVKVGSTTVAADSAGDTLELVAGSNITLTPDATNDKVTIATTNAGTITGVSVNGTSVATSGVANITSVPASILTGAIPSSVTATTQNQSDNSTKLATTAYVRTAISALPASINNLKDGNTYYSLRGEATSEESDSYSMGYAAFAEGYLTKASGYACHAEGYSSISSDSASHAEGFSTEASGSYSHAEGYHTTASGNASHAEGNYTEAKGLNSHAEGDSTYASSQASHAEGFPSSSIVSGTIATIDQNNLTVTVSGLPTYSYYGYQLYDNSNSFKGNQYISTVSGPSSGIYTFVLSQWNNSLAVGGNFNIALRATALGYGSHAEGIGTLAGNRWGTHAEGKGTIAISEAQHVEGKWNKPSSTMAHIVGNGTDFTARSNAYTLDWDGNGVYAGKLTVGTGPSNNMDVATKKYVDDSILALPEPMIFKGSLGTGGTITTLPTASTSNEGYTYKVITAGTYASQSAKVGDTFISDGSAWVLIPSGDEPSGTVTSIKIEATSPIAVNDSSAITSSGTRTISHANSGVTAGTYRSVIVNATGHVTAGTNPTTLSGYGITDAKIASGTITLGSNSITPLTQHQDISGKVNKSGDTMTGALNFANNVANKVGDGVSFGDFNKAGTLGIIGQNGSTGIALIKNGSTWGTSAERAEMIYNSTDKCIEFVFA